MSVIVIDVKDFVTASRGGEITLTIRQAAIADNGKHEAWIAFRNIAGTRINFPVEGGLPHDRELLDKMLSAIPEAYRYRVLESFDEGHYPDQAKKAAKRRTAAKVVVGDGPIRLAGESATPPSTNSLPIRLRFLACDAASKEAAELEELYLRFPWFGFNDAQIVTHTEKHVLGRFDERFPLLAEADRLLGGCLTSVIRELAMSARQPAYDHKTFWRALGACSFGNLQRRCDAYLGVILGGQDNSQDEFEAEAEHVLQSMAGTVATRSLRPHWSEGPEQVEGSE
ncbi:hypothetical protein ELI48_02315 [Rhizobium ruizarguesonis]|uniref:hypothetical protein n=1 Tax=Rhizobium ruizarguesonis TaxID=2081791 RepID=UPI0010316EF5|nr:hypothetical protein [Rhizobium ruizarguesonis]TAU25115.1 hypothetical protein ELI48_02315 [Rhizobium ruizarguesonis]TAU66757.1 hypothetical protein ELI45_02135 [Rhizobium ruizarguesonis]TAW08511.1 hypothetical protein ELI26_02305 [Rhizobium ruizarguesonis]